MTPPAIPPGRYRHFKGDEYDVVGVARHSETGEWLVVYRPVTGDGTLWVRPAMFTETIERDGVTRLRFERVGAGEMQAPSHPTPRPPPRSGEGEEDGPATQGGARERRDVVAGQPIDHGRRDRAREFRRAMTPAEAALWQCLRGHRLAGSKFRRQQVVDGFFADFYCASAGLVVEVDGSAHDGREHHDAERTATLSARRRWPPVG